MSPAPLTITPAQARRFLRRALLIDAPAPDVASALAHHGYIQIDPINVCGRMHDLILRNRVLGYREGDLTRHLHGHGKNLSAENRISFEHHLPSTGVLVAFPLDAWPHLLAAMKARTRRASAWSGRLTPRERDLAPRVFAAIAEQGPLSPDAIDDGRRARRFWGSATLAKSTMQKLFFHGRLLIAQRENNRRIYDLPERILPASILAQPVPPPADTGRWLAILKLRQHRLVRLKRGELALVEDLVQPVRVAGSPPFFCLREDLPSLEAAAAAPAPSAGALVQPLLLAPLDPLIYDRRLTRLLWDFDYTWEVYTPPSRRKRGYYALPVLAGTEIVGHVDPKADRPNRRLGVVSRRLRRGYQASSAVKELATFLNLRVK